MLHVPTDENDNIEIDTNEEIPEGFVVGGGDELTNLESDLDTPGNFKLYFASCCMASFIIIFLLLSHQ